MGYTRRVFDRIVAPAKELLMFDVDRHLLFNECIELATDPLVDCIPLLVAVPETVGAASWPCFARAGLAVTASRPRPCTETQRT